MWAFGRGLGVEDGTKDAAGVIVLVGSDVFVEAIVAVETGALALHA